MMMSNYNKDDRENVKLFFPIVVITSSIGPIPVPEFEDLFTRNIFEHKNFSYKRKHKRLGNTPLWSNSYNTMST